MKSTLILSIFLFLISCSNSEKEDCSDDLSIKKKKEAFLTSTQDVKEYVYSIHLNHRDTFEVSKPIVLRTVFTNMELLRLFEEKDTKGVYKVSSSINHDYLKIKKYLNYIQNDTGYVSFEVSGFNSNMTMDSLEVTTYMYFNFKRPNGIYDTIMPSRTTIFLTN